MIELLMFFFPPAGTLKTQYNSHEVILFDFSFFCMRGFLKGILRQGAILPIQVLGYIHGTLSHSLFHDFVERLPMQFGQMAAFSESDNFLDNFLLESVTFLIIMR